MKSQSAKKKVFVGLSGGVDSAVSAVLLQMAGYNVTGVFIKVWQPDWIECNWKDERREAMRVAAHLGIPFITLDLEEEYKEGVIDYMIAEYKAGRTPNPDVMCNREVKFGAFWRWAEAQGADYIATGHYAQVIPEGSGFRLLAGKDKNKDQSYFLWTLNQNDLGHVLFPVGHLEKREVRRLARKFKLPNSEKKDSQGLCFIGKVDVKEFLSHYLKTKQGNVLNESGKVIGNHSGSLFFTIGERHGFTITKKTPDDNKYYVIDKDIEQNTITVSNKMVGGVLSGAVKAVRISGVNWISESAMNLSQASLREQSRDFADTFPHDLAARGDLSCGKVVGEVGETVPVKNIIVEYPLQARTRYRQPLQNIRIKSFNISETIIEFEKVQDTITPGQSLVIYDGENCLGGGIIE